MSAYQQTFADVIGRHDGHIARYVGDGLLVNFGYPQAHEDDSQRTVSAGLGIIEAIETLNTDVGRSDVTLTVRIGISAGQVVAGDIGTGERREEMGVVGETPTMPADDRYPLLDVSPEELKKRTLEASATVIRAMVSQDPLLMVVEDLHWIDPSTLELLSFLIQQLQSTRVRILVKSRLAVNRRRGASFVLNV